MRIEQLQAFLAVAETGSFGQAAHKCGVTQSTVSRQIQSLESDLGLPLFHRSSQARLTVAGEKVFPRLKKICQEWANITQEIQEFKEGKQPELCLAAIHSVCSFYLPPILRQFCRDYPETQLRVTALGSDRSLKVLRDGLVDIAIVMNNRFLTTSPEMVVTPLYEEPIEILMAANHPLTHFNPVPWSELVAYPQVVFKDGYGMQRLVMDWFARYDSPLNMVMELNTLDAFRGVVRQGEIIALLPKTALKEVSQDPSLAVRSLAPLPNHSSSNGKSDHSFTRQVVLVTTQDRLQIPPMAHFCQLVKEFNPLLNAESEPSLIYHA
ncbi:MAG: LysR family transcriptional regulator [Microcystaceae cyanobacterium]